MTRTTTQITFPPEDDNFYADLKKEVTNYFKSRGITHHGNRRMHLKMLLLFAVYFGAYGILLSSPIQLRHFCP